MIEVTRTSDGDPLGFEVILRVGGGETRHHVTMARDTCKRLTGGTHTPEHCVTAAFQFLLDREPKESILSHFDITVISRYFPEFDRELPRYLSRSWLSRRSPASAVARRALRELGGLHRAGSLEAPSVAPLAATA